MRRIMRRDRSSRCVMIARDKRRLRCNSSVLLRLSKKAVVRTNVKHVALSRSSAGRNASNHSSSHAVSRNKSSVGLVRPRLNDRRGR